MLALSALIAGPIYVVLQTAQRSERAQSAQLELEAQLELVAGRLEDDIREGVPSERRTADPATQLAILRADRDGSRSLILWTVGGGELRRELHDLDSGRSISDVVLLSGLSTTTQALRYWDGEGVEITPSADLVFRCAVRITVDLDVTIGDGVARRTIDVTHRSTDAEAATC